MFFECLLLGFGLDSFCMGFEVFYKLIFEIGVVWDLVYNIYLGNWVELGLIFGLIFVVMGVVLFVVLIGIICWCGLYYIVVIVVVGVMVIVVVYSMVDFSFEMVVNVYLFIILVVMGFVRLCCCFKLLVVDEV